MANQGNARAAGRQAVLLNHFRQVSCSVTLSRLVSQKDLRLSSFIWCT